MSVRTPLIPALICSVIAFSPLAFAGSITAEGSKTKFDTEDIQAVSYQVVSPRDAASGQATGKRQHKPFCVTMAAGANTPLWFQALTTNESLKTVTVDSNGIHFKLTGASLTQLTFNAEKANQEVCFTFQGIEVTHSKSGRVAADSLKSNI
jgi:type VI secretion system secreted protein Hcp